MEEFKRVIARMWDIFNAALIMLFLALLAWLAANLIVFNRPFPPDDVLLLFTRLGSYLTVFGIAFVMAVFWCIISDLCSIKRQLLEMAGAAEARTPPAQGQQPVRKAGRTSRSSG